MYFNMKIVVNDGDEIKFRDALGNFLKSPAVQEFSNNIKSLFNHGLEHGFWSTFQQLVESLDPLGEKNALRVSFHGIQQVSCLIPFKNFADF